MRRGKVILDTDHFRKLKAQVQDFPRSPGVYLMRAEDGEVIYVGKARSLVTRVSSYFKGGDGRQQIEFLLRRVHTLDKIVTASEDQALILERDLINKYKPRYNIRLKDDKSYLSIRIDKSAPWPRIQLTRKIEQDGAMYFGPFTDSTKVKNILEIIKNVIPLRTCSDTIFYNRQRPCLEYQIKRCAGPCCLPVDREEYMSWVDQAVALLQGKGDQTLSYLDQRMQRASDDMRFEEAAILRDKIDILSEYSKSGSQSIHQAESRDVFGLHRQDALATIYICKVRNGRLTDSDSYSFDNVVISSEELLENVILQYYQGERGIPDEIVVAQLPSGLQFLRKILKDRRGSVIELIKPERGSKKHLLEIANINAEQQFQSKFLQEERYNTLVTAMAEKFGLKQIPRRIECLDISNLQGSDIVGAIVSFFDGKPDKEHYRKYKISFQDKPDDFAAVAEVVSRRLKRGKEEGDLPDLLIIDGGKLQLDKALQSRDELEITLDIIALAKMRSEKIGPIKRTLEKPERIFLAGKSEAIILKSEEALTHFFQRIRDEAHRYVITFHRQRRSKRVFRSVLDDIAGLGPDRKARLMRHYGKISRISSADPQELAKVGRMPLPMANKVKNFLKTSLKT